MLIPSLHTALCKSCCSEQRIAVLLSEIALDKFVTLGSTVLCKFDYLNHNDLMHCMYVYVHIQESIQSSLTGGHPDRTTKTNKGKFQ